MTHIDSDDIIIARLRNAYFYLRSVNKMLFDEKTETLHVIGQGIQFALTKGQPIEICTGDIGQFLVKLKDTAGNDIILRVSDELEHVKEAIYGIL